VAAFLRRAGGSMLESTGSHGRGVERRVPEMRRKSALIFWGSKSVDPSSFSYLTLMFVCKQTVIAFGVLFVLNCSFCHSFLFVVDICLLTVCK